MFRHQRGQGGVGGAVGAVGLGGGAPRQTCHARALATTPHTQAHISIPGRAQPRPHGHVTEGGRGRGGHLRPNVYVCVGRAAGCILYPLRLDATCSFRPRAAAPLVADALRRAKQRVRGALRRRRLAHQLARLRVAHHVPQPVAGEQQPRVGAWDGSTPKAKGCASARYL